MTSAASEVLQGRVAIVTGAASPIGMGRSITTALVRAGARVAMLDINEDWLEQTANDMRELGGDDSVLPIIADVTDPNRRDRRLNERSVKWADCTFWSITPGSICGPADSLPREKPAGRPTFEHRTLPAGYGLSP